MSVVAPEPSAPVTNDAVNDEPVNHGPETPANARWFLDERVVLGIIALNALVLFLRGFHGWPAGAGRALLWLDWLCTVFFVLEQGIKWRLLGWSTHMSGAWNRFDFAVVVASLPSLAEPWLPVTGFGIVLAIRAGRLFRLVRVMRFIPNQDQLVAGISRAIRASFGVLLALGLYNFVLGLVGYQLFHDVHPGAFGDPATAVYSMFKVFTLEGWFEIPDHIARTGGAGWGALARSYFVFAVVTGGLFGLSMANAVFVDEMVLDNNAQLETDLRAVRAELAETREALRALQAGQAAMLQAMGAARAPEQDPDV